MLSSIKVLRNGKWLSGWQIFKEVPISLVFLNCTINDFHIDICCECIDLCAVKLKMKMFTV